MSLAVPTPQEYRTALDRLQGEHARRVLAEQEAARLRDVLAKRSDAMPRGWSLEMYRAASLLQAMDAEPENVTRLRRGRLLEAAS